MERRTRTVGAWVLAAVLVGACGGEPSSPRPAPPDHATASFDAAVAAVHDRVEIYDGIATGVIALVRVGDDVQVVTQGLSRVRGRRPMTADQTFPIASVTKPMVATLVLQLVEERRIDLDDDLRGLVPQLRPISSPITVEQVLSHRSGLVSDPRPADVRRLGTGATGALVEAGARLGLDFEPGSDGRYSNLGFAALGLLVERELHQPLGQALADRVFEPAGMDSASLGDAPDVQGYAEDGPVDNYYLDYLPGAGSVVTDARDLDRFFNTLWSGDLLPDDVVTDMRASRGRVQVDRYFSLDYGLGLMRLKVGCGTAVGHSGRIGGFTIEAWNLEGTDRSTVVSVNDQDAGDIARGIVQTALCEG